MNSKKPVTLPQISRFISANVLPLCVSCLAYTAVVGLFIINIYSVIKHPISQYSLILHILEGTQAEQAHITLAHILWSSKNSTAAGQELRLVSPGTQRKAYANILGLTTDEPDLLTEWNQIPATIEEKLVYWKGIISAKPDYRDAYIIMGGLSYQLGNKDEATNFLSQALALDPNDADATRLLTIISKGK
jgi:hypothetical protein